FAAARSRDLAAWNGKAGHDSVAAVVQLEAVRIAVDLLQALARVAQADAFPAAAEGSGVEHLDAEIGGVAEGAHVDHSRSGPQRDAVADGILRERLQDQRRDGGASRV